ncbi:MAG: S46 family peptidase [Casimicrobiaceae bacterium]
MTARVDGRPTHMILVAAIAWLAATPAHADEGAWLLDDLPREALQARYAFVPDAAWLEDVRLAALNVGGASASFVSASGLVLTNHHVVQGCLQKLSLPEQDLVANGFLALQHGAERACPGMELKRLESSEDVTTAVRAAVKATDPAAANAERNAAMARLETACAAATGLRCGVETLYRGARYRLLRYRIFRDVRLVFAPESSVGFFGGDPDNFVYPRFALDAAFLRVYESGVPLRPAHFLRWSARGVAEGDVVFAPGHPYSTDRLVTVAQMQADREVRYPLMMATARRQQALLRRFGAQSPEATRRAADNLFGTENWLKSMQGELKALGEPTLMARKRAEEALLLRAWQPEAGRVDPFARIADATARRSAAFAESWAVDYGYHTLFETAGRIVEIANERTLPDAERLADYRDAAIEQFLARLTADAPVYKDLEIVRLANDWEQARELLGLAHPFVRLTTGDSTASRRATEQVEDSRLDRVAERKALIDGGLAAVNASTDPLIVLARAVYPLRRRLARTEEAIDEVIRTAADEIAALQVVALGSARPPDATGSLRLSYGVVRGYDADGIRTPWRTNFGGLFARHDAFGGAPPFTLPPRWRTAQRELAPATPLNFVSTLDIIGGNSGSPVVNRDREVVGVVFDGNLESLGWRFAYTDDKARAIAVDGRAIVEALDKVYGARALVAEILGH